MLISSSLYSEAMDIYKSLSKVKSRNDITIKNALIGLAS